MNVKEVRARVEKIRALAAAMDDEAAHSLEDELYLDLLRHFAAKGSALAFAALETQAIAFARHKA